MQVLVVDDERDHRELIGGVLTDAGLTVVLVASAQEAIAHLQCSRAPSAIVLDLLLPLMTGWELLAWLAKREVLRRVSVVVVSAATPHLERVHALHPAVVAVMEKPFRVAGLVDAVRAAAARTAPLS